MINIKVKQNMNVIEEMSKNGLTSEQYEECLQLIIDKKDGLNDVDWQEICNQYNLPISSDTLRKANGTIFGGAFVSEYFKNKKELDHSSTIDDLQRKYNSETSINKDGTYSSNKLLVMNEEQCKNTEYILEAHGFDPLCWQIISARNNIRQVISKQDGIVTLYASFITVKPITNLTLGQIENFYKELNCKYPSRVVKQKHFNNEGYLLEVPIVDVHFGKLSLSEDVAEPYNFQLAKERFASVIDNVIQEVDGIPVKKIVFPIGDDFFNSDTISSTTTGGTQQYNDLSPQLMFKYGLECLIENIIKLSDIAPVEVFCVNGNHDFLSSYHAICSLDCYFHNDENVIVNTNTSPRKYVEFGENLIGFAHGDKEKKRIEGLMQIEAREAWGRTKYREIHLGHLHSQQVREVNGIVIRNLPSFTGTDLWHHNSGYVGSLKTCMCFLYDEHKGLKKIIYTNID